ncbi:MAG TPA: hypothetical protein VG602_01520 [Actinomycetota bacterium]|nr:hypothetical protein [Actinomycetota bacterium]
MLGKPKRRGRWFERLALGAVMTLVAVIVERRLKKLIRKKELPGPAEQVEDQPTG